MTSRAKTAFSPKGLPAPPLFILLFHIFKNGIFTERVTGSTPFHPLASHLHKTASSPRGLPAPPLFILLFHIFKNGIFTERVTGSTPFHPLVSHLQKRHFHREGYRLHPFSSSCFTSSKTAFSPRRVTGSTPFNPLASHLQKRHFHRKGYRLHPFSSSCFTSSKTAFSPRGLPAPPLFILLFISSKTAFSPRGLPAPPLFILLFHIFKNGIFTERVTGSTPFHPLVSYLQKRHFHREGYRLHPFKTAFSPRGLPAPPLFTLLFHIFKNGIFTERVTGSRVTGSTPFHPLVSHLQKRHFHREGYRLHPFSSSCFTSSKTAFSPRGLPAPPLFFLLFHIFKNGLFTERVTGSTPFHPLVSYLQKRHFHREGYRLHPFSSSCFTSSKTAFSPRGLPAPPFSSSCFTSSKTAFSPRGLPAPPLFLLLFHIFKNGSFTERVTGSTPFHPLVSYLQKRHIHREGYRLHPFSSFWFTSSKTAFSPRGLPAPPLFLLLFHIFKNGIFTERVTGSTPFPPLVSHLHHREGYRLHPFSSSCFISSKTAFSPRGLPAPPLFILFFYIFKNGIFTERVTGSTPFHLLFSHLQKRHFHREGYRLHPFSFSCFISSKTAFSLLFHIFKNGIFTERVTGSTPFHPLVSHLQKRHFHREGYRLHPFSSSSFISSKTAFSPRGLPAPPLFILLFHIFKNGIFTERVTGSTPFHPLFSYLQKRHLHREGYRLHPFSSSFFTSSKTAFSPKWLPAPPLFILLFHIFKNGIFTERVTGSTPFILLFHIFKNGIFTERVTGSTPFHPLASHLQKRHFHREGYRLHPFSSSCFTSSKTAFSPRGLPAPPLFLLLFHIFKNGIFTERVTGSTPFHPLVSHLQKRHFHREGYRLHPFSASCFISSKTAFSPRGLPAPPLFILLFHIFKNGIFTERVTGSTPFHPLFSYLQKRHFHREGYRLHPFSSSCFISSKTAFSPRGLPAPPLFILLFHIFKNGIFTERVTGSTPFHPLVSYLQKRHFHREGYRLHPFSSSFFHIFKNGIFTERVTGSTPFHPLVSHLQKRHFHREGYRLHPFSSSCFTSSKTAFSPRGLSAPPLFILFFHIFKNGIFTEKVTGSTPFRPLASHLQKRHIHREGYRLHPFSSFWFTSSKTAYSPRGLPAPPLFILLFHIFKNGIFTERVTGPTPFPSLVSHLQKRHIQREGYRLHPFSSSCFTSSKTAFSPRGLPAPPLFILLFHIFKNGIFTERVTGSRVTGSTPFHPLASYLQKRHIHRRGYRSHPFSSSCFTSSKTAFSPRGLPAPPLFILLLHILKNGIFTERVTGSTPFHPLASHLQKRHFHREGYRLHPFSSSCFTSSKTAFSPRGLPAPPLFILLFHIFKNGIFTERVTGSTPFHPLASYLEKRHFHREGYRLHPFSSSCFISSKTAFSPRGLPAPPLFILLLHISKNGIFTERVTGSTPFHPLVSHLQKRHFHREGYRLHPFSSSCFTSSKTAFSPRGLPAPPLFILLFHIFKNGIFTETGYRLHPFSSFWFTSSKTAFSLRGLPAPPLFILLFHSFKNGIFTERVTGSTPFHPLVSHLQKRHFHREGYRLHPFSSSCFISSKTAFSPRGLPAPPLFILLFHIFKNGIFTERVTGSTPFHPLASHLQKRHFHREGYRLHPFSSSCFTSSKTAFSPRGLPAPPLFILFFHIFKNGIFTETGYRPPFPSSFFLSSKTAYSLRGLPAPPLHPLVSHLQKRHFHREGYRLHPFSSSCFTSSKTTFSPRGLPAPPFFFLLLHIFKNGIFTERVTGPTPFHPLVSHLQKRHFHREGYRLHPFSSSCFISLKTAFSPRGLPAPPLFLLLFHIFKNGIFTERVTGSTPFHPLASHLQKRHFHREGYRLHPFSSSCFISSKTAFSPRGLPAPPLSSSCFTSSKTAFTGSTPFRPLVSHLQKTAFSPRGLPAPPLFILLFHIFKNGIFTERVTGSTPFHPLFSYLQKRHFHREGYFSSSCFIASKTAFSPRGLPAPPLFILLFHIFKNGIFTEMAPGSTPFHPLVSHLQKRHFHRKGYRPHPFPSLVSHLRKRHFYREGYRLHPFSSSCFASSKTAFSPRGLPAPPLFFLLFHIFKNGIFTERVTGSTPFHPLVSHLQKRHFHREGYRLHPFSSSCFISSKTAFSPRWLPAPPLFILLFHIFKNGIFTERVTSPTPFPPLVSYLRKRHFYREGYRLHPFSSSCFTSSKTAYSPRG